MNIGIFLSLCLSLVWCGLVTAVYIKSPMYKMATVGGGGGGGLLGFFGRILKSRGRYRRGRFWQLGASRAAGWSHEGSRGQFVTVVCGRGSSDGDPRASSSRYKMWRMCLFRGHATRLRRCCSCCCDDFVALLSLMLTFSFVSDSPFLYLFFLLLLLLLFNLA